MKKISWSLVLVSGWMCLSCGKADPVTVPTTVNNPQIKGLNCDTYQVSYKPVDGQTDQSFEILKILGGLNSGFQDTTFSAFAEGEIVFLVERDPNRPENVEASLEALSQISGVDSICREPANL